jgi:hypothetical protein
LDEKTLQVWNVASCRRIGEFPTVFQFGGDNLAIDPDAKQIIAGTSTRNGSVAGYSVETGRRVWFRKPLRYPTRIRFTESASHVVFTLDNRAVERVNSHNGETDAFYTNTTERVEGPGGLYFISPAGTGPYQLIRESTFQISKITSALLSIAFGTDSLCISESGGPVRAIEYATGTEKWRYVPPAGSHFLKLFHVQLDGLFYGILRHYEKGLFRFLVKFDGHGKAANVCSLVSWEEEYVPATRQLVTSDGDIINLADGRVVSCLEFPRLAPRAWD